MGTKVNTHVDRIFRALASCSWSIIFGGTKAPSLRLLLLMHGIIIMQLGKIYVYTFTDLDAVLDLVVIGHLAHRCRIPLFINVELFLLRLWWEEQWIRYRENIVCLNEQRTIYLLVSLLRRKSYIYIVFSYTILVTLKNNIVLVNLSDVSSRLRNAFLVPSGWNLTITCEYKMWTNLSIIFCKTI